MLEDLKKAVYEANLLLPKYGLVTFTWGNVSGVDREKGLFVIKPSGVPYEDLHPEDMVVVDFDGHKVEGSLNPSSDTATHAWLYKNWDGIGGVVHTHSSYATSWAQSGRSIPCYGTTHADYYYGEVPCLRCLTKAEIDEAYELNTGKLIVSEFARLGKDPEAVPACLCKNHGPFAWGKDPIEAVHSAVVLEEVAKMAYRTELINPKVQPAPQELQDKHYYRAKSGHPGGSLSAADLLTFLYFEEMNIDPKDPKKEDRDRFVLSKGHAAPGLYATMAERGYFPMKEMETLRHVGARLQGHPSMNYLPGLDMSSGSLGQGISAAVGMALGAKHQNKTYRVYTLLGDGECEEGEVWEASMFAGAKKLDNLVVIVDNNNLQIDGTIVDVNNPYPLDKKFEAFNFHVINIDGHDFDQIRAALAEAKQTKGMPTAIIMKTTKGKGVSFMENQVGWHGKAPNDEEFKIAMDDLEKIGASLK